MVQITLELVIEVFSRAASSAASCLYHSRFFIVGCLPVGQMSSIDQMPRVNRRNPSCSVLSVFNLLVLGASQCVTTGFSVPEMMEHAILILNPAMFYY